MTPATRAHIASARFGLGPRPGELRRIEADPRGWLLGQLRPDAPLPAPLRDQISGAEGLAEAQERRIARRQGREPTARREAQGQGQMPTAPGSSNAQAPGGQPRQQMNPMALTYRAEVAALSQVWAETDQPFRERLVNFWTNHFTVSVTRPIVRPMAGAFVREAIRPHVTGRFADMLLAVARHPAMLMYLDNAVSIGPGSPAGARTGRGLNENLAREILELHTLGVNGGYTQADVTSFARILTGWSVPRAQDGYTGARSFMFRHMAHEPGEKVLLGKRYPGGEEGGIAALRDLAQHPATAKFIAAKLARHFVADVPPPGAVAKIEQVFRNSRGDLGAVSRALVDLPEAWASPLPKLRSPKDFVIAALRAAGAIGTPEGRIAAFAILGQPVFAAPSPAGWPDTADAWASPEAIMRRIDWSHALASRLMRGRPPLDMLAETIAPVASAETVQAIQRAPEARDALTLLFASPEFQRR
ncbi:MAG: DUF1800 family protein [Alphaproteobacteria bacterium]|nr:DUF1800 family protein [Alphaproteobacteria bacterium]